MLRGYRYVQGVRQHARTARQGRQALWEKAGAVRYVPAASQRWCRTGRGGLTPTSLSSFLGDLRPLLSGQLLRPRLPAFETALAAERYGSRVDPLVSFRQFCLPRGHVRNELGEAVQV